ncbi:MAG TPA: VOC family protein [Solirubrobacterales bacterium]|nr:VOC family protein [Solirubrobacterales bacterium]
MHIGHVALQVTDLDESVRHAQETLGLRLTARGEADAFLTANEKRHELQLIAGTRNGLDHIGLEVEDASELEAVRDRSIAAGAEILSEKPLEPGFDAAIRVRGPASLVFEIYTGMERQPLALANVLLPIAQKLGHVTLFAEDKPELELFVLEALGFRVSDRWGDFATWMRCDPDHHGLAVGKTTGANRLHHYAFELESWATVGAYADRVARSGQEFLWGPGRHGPGFNIFTYLADPAGAIVEAYTDLLRIDNDAAYQEIDWSQEERAMNLWGPAMPDDWDDLGIPILDPAS